MDSRELFSVALHEACHGLTAHALGLPYHSVMLHDPPLNGANGCLYFADGPKDSDGPVQDEPKSLARLLGDVADSFHDGRRGWYWRRIVTLTAGCAGHDVITEMGLADCGQVTSRFEESVDAGKSLGFARVLNRGLRHPPHEVTQAAVGYAALVARAYCRLHADAIVELAKELVRTARVDYARCVEIFEATPHTEPPPADSEATPRPGCAGSGACTEGPLRQCPPRTYRIPLEFEPVSLCSACWARERDFRFSENVRRGEDFPKHRVPPFADCPEVETSEVCHA